MKNKRIWFELFMDSGLETNTLEICGTLKEAIEVRDILYTSMLENVYIDKWIDIDNPRIIKSY